MEKTSLVRDKALAHGLVPATGVCPPYSICFLLHCPAAVRAFGHSNVTFISFDYPANSHWGSNRRMDRVYVSRPYCKPCRSYRVCSAHFSQKNVVFKRAGPTSLDVVTCLASQTFHSYFSPNLARYVA